MKLKIKRIIPADIGPLSSMIADMREESNLDYPDIDADEIEKLMFLILGSLNDPMSIYLMAFDGKKPVGFFIGNISRHAYGKPELVGMAQELYVVPDKRGSIVGLSLIKEAVKLALAIGVQGFEAVGTFGKTDQRWIKLGFKPYATYLHLDKDTTERIFVSRKSKKDDKHENLQ